MYKINCIHPVWITLTTIPDRMDKTYQVLKDMLNGLSGFDKLILNVPFSYKRFEMNNKGLQKLESIRDSRFILNRCRDHGPLTKILPTLDIIPQDTILLVCDDDCYHYDAFGIAAKAQENNKSKTFTYYKYNYNGVQVPQGVDIISFWTPNLNGFKQFALRSLQNEYCFYVDDMVIGSYLDQNGIHVEQLERKWKWPWKPCYQNKVKSKVSLFGQKGKYNRETSNLECYNYLNR